MRLPVAGALFLIAVILSVVKIVRDVESRALLTVPEAVVFEAAIGEVIGSQLGRDMPEGGKVFVLRAYRNPGHPATRAVELRIEGLQKATKGLPFDFVHGGPQPASAEVPGLVTLDMNDPLGDAADWCREAGDVKAVVCFLDYPDGLSEAKLEELPPVYGMINGRFPELEAWVASGEIKAASIPREDADYTARPSPKWPAEKIFAVRYRLLRP